MKLTQQGKAAQFKKDKVFRIKKKRMLLEMNMREFPGGPVVRTRRSGFNSGQGTKIPASRTGQHSHRHTKK